MSKEITIKFEIADDGKCWNLLVYDALSASEAYQMWCAYTSMIFSSAGENTALRNALIKSVSSSLDSMKEYYKTNEGQEDTSGEMP